MNRKIEKAGAGRRPEIPPTREATEGSSNGVVSRFIRRPVGHTLRRSDVLTGALPRLIPPSGGAESDFPMIRVSQRVPARTRPYGRHGAALWKRRIGQIGGHQPDHVHQSLGSTSSQAANST